MEGDITGKWELVIYEKGSDERINTVFIKEFRSDLTYTFTSTLYKRWGGAASKNMHQGTYTFQPVKKIETGFPPEKVKGKPLFLLTRKMEGKNLLFTRYVQFVDENTMWVWGRAPGLSGLHTRILSPE